MGLLTNLVCPKATFNILLNRINDLSFLLIFLPKLMLWNNRLMFLIKNPIPKIRTRRKIIFGK